jgi:mono/diheme cytochrome c family protein/sugar lactone lactonase YvrE
LLSILATVQLANAHSYHANRETILVGENAPVGHAAVPSQGPHRGSSGSTVVADEHGVLVAERNAGAIVRADRTGRPVAKLELTQGVGQLVSATPKAVFVADTGGDRIVRIDASAPDRLVPAGELELGAPYGLALSPDGNTLYATSIADHALVAIDTASLKERWRAELRPEPRGVAVSPDGNQATVGFLSSGALAVVDLEGRGDIVRWRTLQPRDHVEIEEEESEWDDEEFHVAVVKEARSRFQVPTDTGRRHARNVFGVAYVGHAIVAAPHQLSTPQMKRIPSSQMQDSYGGGPESVPPIVHRLALVDGAATEQARSAFSKLRMHQPRALAYDAAHDTLYLAGYGDDSIAAIGDVSQPSVYTAWVADSRRNQGKAACGPDGIAIDGDSIWVHCELSRKLIRIAPDELNLDDQAWYKERDGVSVGPELAASLRSEQIEAGAELFRRGGDWRISDSGVMACASCHPDGRQDGLSWRLGKSILQTPMLAGRVEGTAPYKWNGEDEDLTASFKHTLQRLGGNPDSVTSSELRALAAYVTSLPAPRAPRAADIAAIERGRELFTQTLDCSGCHDGDALTDGGQYPLASRGLETTDTPSLIGLAHTAPYYHDGSAPDLYSLVTDKGSVHDMSDFSDLDPANVRDLVAYLESL